MKDLGKKPLVSIVIPVYNAEQYIEEAIQSALSQTYRNIEVICADDCSKDNSVDVIQSLIKKSSNVKLFKTKKNSKTSAARNLAIRNSNGEYILPLDADDKIHPEYVEKAIKAFEKNKTIGVVYCNARKFGAKNEPWDLPDFCKMKMMYKNIVHCSGMYKKSDWKKYDGYCELLKEGLEDWDFWLSFVEDNQKFYNIKEELFFYRVFNDNKNRTKKVTKSRQKLKKAIKSNHPKLYSIKNQLMAHLLSSYVFSRSIKKLRRFLISINLKNDRKLIRILGVKLLDR